MSSALAPSTAAILSCRSPVTRSPDHVFVEPAVFARFFGAVLTVVGRSAPSFFLVLSSEVL